jgi:hypothetical protein
MLFAESYATPVGLDPTVTVVATKLLTVFMSEILEFKILELQFVCEIGELMWFDIGLPCATAENADNTNNSVIEIPMNSNSLFCLVIFVTP